MPIPTELANKQLIGSRWIRRIGKHRGTQVVITSFNDAGVKFEVRTRTAPGARSHLGDKRLGSVQWPMFTTLYEPEGILPMMVTIDKEGYVVKTPHVDLTRPVKVEGKVTPEVVTQTEMRMCMGPWHRKSGKGTPIPVTEFDRATRGRSAGQLRTACRSCVQRHKEYDEKRAIKNGRVSKAFIKPPAVTVVATPTERERVKEPIIEEARQQLAAPGRYQWKVTIVKPTEVVVWADDFLSAGVAAGDGEIVKVERV